MKKWLLPSLGVASLAVASVLAGRSDDAEPGSVRIASTASSAASAPAIEPATMGGTTQAAATPIELEPRSPRTDSVSPIDWSSFPTAMPTTNNSLRIKGILNKANQYALTTWWNTAKNYDAQTATYLDFGGVQENNIRPAAAEAFSLAVALKLGSYDASVTGVSAASAETITLKLIRSLAYRHRSNTSGGWGDVWQSGLWSSLAGTAGWLMWDDLSAMDQECVRRMVEAEANRFIGYETPYYRSATGTILNPGDTKAEENSWNANILQLATAMMPAHRFYRAWIYKEVELMLSSYARPADVASPVSYNGSRLSDWLRGSNANDDYLAVNHSQIHPDYMITVHQNLSAALLYPLAGRPAPRSAFLNAAGIYSALVDLNFSPSLSYPDTPGPIASPGGTIYIDGSGDLYYPQGNDWGTHRRMNSALMDAMADAFSFDGGTSVKGLIWEALHAQKQVDYQARFADGRTFGAVTEDKYDGREEAVAMLAAKAWWTKWIRAKALLAQSDQFVAVVVDNRDLGFTRLGAWTAVNNSSTQLGSGFFYAVAGTGSSRARFTPKVPQTGNYEVYAWWPIQSAAANNARFTIATTTGPTTVVVDQTTNGGRWVALGNFSLAGGASAYVELDDNANGRVAADGILIKPVGSP